MPTAPLPPLLPADLSAAVAEQIVELIRAEDLRPGDRLPSLRSLAVRFAVAPSTLREAVRRLQATGAVDLRHGAGTFVGSGQERLILANPTLTLGRVAPETVLHLLDARLLIEPCLAGLAAERASAEALADLERLLREAERHLFPNDPTIGAVNSTFHDVIARAAGNPVLAETDRVLLELYGVVYSAVFPPGRARPRDLHDHAGIFAAIRAGEHALATERMRRHLVEARAEVEQKMATAGLPVATTA